MRLRRLQQSLAAIVGALILAGCAGNDGGGTARGPGSYSHTLHTRFYEAWRQPDEIRRTARRKISVPVDVLIDKRGRVLEFKPARRSGYPKLDASIDAIGRRVRKVAAPPGNGPFKLRIYFVLDVRR